MMASSLASWFGVSYCRDVWEPMEFGGYWSWDYSRSRHVQALDDVTNYVITETDEEWSETENDHIFCVDLPGVRKEEVKVDLDASMTLQIRWEHMQQKEDANDKWHSAEMTCGNFMMKSIKIPENCKLGEMKWTMENEMLTVTVPKKETMESKRPEILECL